MTTPYRPALLAVMPCRVTRRVVALALAALGGCWTHPTKSTADFHAERTACEQRAVAMYPVVIVQRQTSPGRWIPGTTQCTTTNAQTRCVTSPGRWEPPTWTTEDANAGARSGVIDDCLRAGGWTWQWN
jgi:hypothetical protein